MCAAQPADCRQGKPAPASGDGAALTPLRPRPWPGRLTGTGSGTCDTEGAAPTLLPAT
jgi:hypothetical protein